MNKKAIWIRNPIFYWIHAFMIRYNDNLYWKVRSYVVEDNKGFFVLKYILLFWLKRVESRCGASMGTNVNTGAYFVDKPILPHGLKGIIIGQDALIGRNCYIHHQVTIAHGGVVIGDDVYIGAGAKILSGVKIGNDVKIGANCVVVSDVVSNATVVLQKPRVIINAQ